MIRKWLKRVALGLALALILLLLTATWLLRASLPELDGSVTVTGLSAPVTIERDGLGVPTVRGANRLDVSRATGFLHAQERFFQMDLMRRRAAGELAELIGPAVLAQDRRHRVNRFRWVAGRSLARLNDEERALIEAYAEGVNAGLDTLGARPPEYLLLRAAPESWSAEDSVLVALSMYIELQGDRGRLDSVRGLMHDLLPKALYAFLDARGTEWDAPLVGGRFGVAPLPSPEAFDLRQAVPADGSAATADEATADVPGSNAWAVAGDHAAGGGALLANDMHLSLGLPNIWYRAAFAWTDESGEEHAITGVTLPGAPPIIVGSNGHIAWGFTNSQGDYSDLIVLESDGDSEPTYLTPEGPRTIERIEETISVKGAPDETLVVEWTRWGPVIDRDHLGRRRVLRWIAHDPESVNLNLFRMERARNLDQALEIAVAVGISTQNCVIADRDGRVGWTLMGPVPRRRVAGGRVPLSWAVEEGWSGYLPAELYPRVVDPPSGRVWTANNRVVGGEAYERVGDGGLALGARATQIRDRLMAIDRATESDMLDLQLDDRALFLERWRELLLATLTPEACAQDARRGELRRLVEESWTGRASIDSVGYRMVRAFRLFLSRQVLDSLTAPCRESDDRFSPGWLLQAEGPLWRLVTERPPHLLDPRFADWNEQLLSAVDAMLDRFAKDEGPLEQRTWGERNTVKLRHPISYGVPALSGWLDITARPLPGGSHMPRAQSPNYAASMRMTVSPGREQDGLFHMPGGQSGHPLSAYYRAGHDDWAEGKPTPFLPGPAVHRLSLLP